MVASSRSVERALHLVRLLASAGRRGAALTELASSAALSHTTVHRLLQRLIAERLALQLESKRYALGPLAFELGIAAAAQFDVWQFARSLIRSFANEVGDTVYLVVRSAGEAVCIERADGPSPLRVLTLEAGSRRPLGLGAGGLAILAALPRGEREEAIRSVTPAILSQSTLTRAGLYDAIDRYHRDGYALVRNRVTLGTSAVGVHINDAFGSPVAAISVAAVDSRMAAKRVLALARRLQTASKQIQHTLKDYPVSVR
ncbi:IclR family transcriptional regulator [Paraburkholderia pallida]|nr:IclR family transcriptional regulator [Paraburkholderia pallida]